MESNVQEAVLHEAKFAKEIENIKIQLVSASNGDKGKKRKILEEDDFAGQIESIIERDFYPDVPKMRLELEYADAVEKNDYEKISKLAKEKLEQRNKEKSNATDTPAYFETPLNKNNEIQSQEDNNTAIKNDESTSAKDLKLNKFLNKFTSEDNDSFEKLQEKSLQKYNEKMELINNQTKLHNEKIEQSLVLPSIETQQMIKSSKECSGNKLITWKYNHKNSVLFDPEGVPLTKEEAEHFKSRQVIVHENTRFKSNPFCTLKTVVQNVANPLKMGKFGVDGKEFTSKTTPNVNGFSFVSSTPCLRPESLPDSPLMTWGEIEATPINLKGDATPLLHSGGSHFVIPEIPEKEVIGQELANRILSRKRNVQKTNSSNNSLMRTDQKSSLERLSSMSPAAQLLATKKLGVHQHLDHSLQASYSPLLSSVRTPTPRRIITPTPRSTPLSTPKLFKTPFENNKRKKAAEFF